MVKEPDLYWHEGYGWVTIDVLETVEERVFVRQQLPDILRVPPQLSHNGPVRQPAKKRPRKEKP